MAAPTGMAEWRTERSGILFFVMCGEFTGIKRFPEYRSHVEPMDLRFSNELKLY